MKFDIFQKAIPQECMHAFLEKKVRYDGRKFNDERQFSFTSKVFESFPFSALGTLGLNKVLLVLKENDKNCFSKSNVKVVIDNFNSNKVQSLNQLYIYINKLISGNLTTMNKDKFFTLYITIESIDGNIYDTISLSLSNFFANGNETGIEIKNRYITKSFCLIEGNVLIDPGKNEKELAEFLFNVIKFKDGECYIHKIKGDFIEWELMKKIINSIQI